jgi:hypothetical protein
MRASGIAHAAPGTFLTLPAPGAIDSDGRWDTAIPSAPSAARIEGFRGRAASSDVAAEPRDGGIPGAGYVAGADAGPDDLRKFRRMEIAAALRSLDPGFEYARMKRARG